MQCLYLDPRYQHEEFAKTFLPYYLNACAQAEIKKNPTKYQALSKYLSEHYSLSLVQAIKICCNNFEYVVLGPRRAEFRQNSIQRYKQHSIISVYNLINSGNLSVRGVDLFDKLLRKLSSNLQGYYRVFLLYNSSKKGRKWQ